MAFLFFMLGVFMKLKFIFSSLVLSLLIGCQATRIDDGKQRVFTYNFSVPNTDKDIIWIRARDYLATAYGDSREVLSVQDKESSTLIGKALVSWYLLTNECLSKYEVRFMAKDDKARLRLSLLDGVPADSECMAWPMPSKGGYKEITRHFDKLALDIEKNIGKQSNFSDF